MLEGHSALLEGVNRSSPVHSLSAIPAGSGCNLSVLSFFPSLIYRTLCSNCRTCCTENSLHSGASWGVLLLLGTSKTSVRVFFRFRIGFNGLAIDVGRQYGVPRPLRQLRCVLQGQW